MSKASQPSNIFISHEEELKKLFTLLSFQDEVFDKRYIIEKVAGSCNRIPLCLHANLEEVHRDFWEQNEQ